jgi:hypothetical protein
VPSAQLAKFVLTLNICRFALLLRAGYFSRQQVRCLRCHLRIFSRRPLGNITPQVTQTIEPSGIFNSKMPMYRTYTAFVFLITARGFSSERWCWNYYFIFCSAAPLFEGEYDVRRCDDAREEMKTVDCPANRSDQPHGFWELIGSKTKMTPYHCSTSRCQMMLGPRTTII